MARFLIITADDFGLHPAINEAVELASQSGALTSASLMVGEAAAEDAVRRARKLPDLRVGLHLTLADGHALLSRARIPDLIDAQGRFGDNMVRDGLRFFALPGVRRQLEEEIRAQFEAFKATGLKLDHVNAHKHFHLHPTILSKILQIGNDFGLTAAGIRVPYEPAWATSIGNRTLAPWVLLMKWRLRRAGIRCNDQLFGLSSSGDMSEARLLTILSRLPDGISEIYLHPATRSGTDIAPAMRGYRHTHELSALLSARVLAKLESMRAMGLSCGGYSDLR